MQKQAAIQHIKIFMARGVARQGCDPYHITGSSLDFKLLTRYILRTGINDIIDEQ
jgi:hypothetical protein